MPLNHFATLLELPTDNIDLLLKETRHKFQGTWMVIDDELFKVDEIFKDSLLCLNSSGKSKEIHELKTLKPFLPSTGIYLYKKETISLRKIVQKQWRKSFCWELYSATTKDFVTPFKIFEAIKAGKDSAFDGIAFNKGNVFYLDKLIGNRDEKDVYHVVPEFYQELVDLFGESRVEITTAPVKTKKKPKKAEEEIDISIIYDELMQEPVPKSAATTTSWDAVLFDTSIFQPMNIKTTELPVISEDVQLQNLKTYIQEVLLGNKSYETF